MNFRLYPILSLAALLVLTGCAKTKITDRDEIVTGQLPRPTTIWVYNFAATPEDLPVKTSLDKEYFANSMPQTAENIAEGRKLGDEIETELVYELNNMGMSSQRAVKGITPQLNDLVIEGYIISYLEGNEAKRFGIGLGAGASNLKVAVEGLQMTTKGLSLLGSGKTDAEGNKTPGAAVGLATMLATHNPVGLIVSSGMKLYDDKSGKSGVGGRAKQTAKEIAKQLEKRFKEEGWM
jgi:hypothetical protein